MSERDIMQFFLYEALGRQCSCEEYSRQEIEKLSRFPELFCILQN